MSKFNLVTSFFTSQPTPTGAIPTSTVGGFNLNASGGLAPQLNFQDVVLPAEITALAAGAPIQVLKSNQSLVVIGVLIAGAALYFSRKGK